MNRWPRYCELAIALWLIVSPWVVEHPFASEYLLVSMGAGLAILLVDVLSIAGVMRYSYLLVLAVSAALLAYAFSMAPADAQGTQNLIVVALLLLMFGILPTEATRPPLSWRRFHGDSR